MVEVASPILAESVLLRRSRPGVTHAEQTPVVEHSIPAPAVSYAVSYAAPTPVVVNTAPAPAMTYTEHALVDEYTVSLPAVSCALLSPVDEAIARVREYGASVPLDVYDASLGTILDDFHQSMQRITYRTKLELCASSSSACAASSPVSDWERAAEDLVRQDELETKPVEGKHKR